MPAEATDTTYILIADDNKIADVVSTALEFQGYRIRKIHTAYRRADAYLEISERARFPGGWHYEFKISVNWTPDPHGAELKVTVCEMKHDDQESINMAEKRCQDLIIELIDTAEAARISLENSPPDTRHGSAQFAGDAELRDKGYVTDKSDQARLIVAPLGTELISIPADLTPHHALVCGPTGLGKTSGIFIPNIINRVSTSMIVTEATLGKLAPELFQKTAGWRRDHGHQIYWFNPGDMTSTRINPIDLVRWADEDDKAAQAETIANLLIKNTEGPKEARVEPFWDRAEKHLLMALIIHVAADEPKLGHLAAIRWHLLRGLPHLTPLMRQSPSDVAAAEYNGFLVNTTDEIRKGVITGVFNRLNPWLTPQVATLTAVSDVRPDELAESLFTFYLSAPVRRPDLQGLSVLLLNYLIELALSLKFKHDLALMLDEFANFGYIFGATELLATVRKSGISAVLGVQNMAQVAEVYGQRPAEIILAQPGTLVFTRPNTLDEAEAISRALDTFTHRDVQINDLGRRFEHVMPRPLLRPGEIRALEKSEAIIFTPSTHPLRRKLFHWSQYKHATQVDPPERSPHEITDFIRRFGREEIPPDLPEDAEPKAKNQRKDIDPPEKGRSRGDSPDFFND